MKTAAASRTATAYVPTREDVARLGVGDKALDAFGRWRPVVEISFRGVDVNGDPYVGYCTGNWYDDGHPSTISGSYKAGKLVRTVALSCLATSDELRKLEAEMVAAGESVRTVE
ncbi:MAG: hypothetical protein V4537_14215 [Pseudomonadota bacterium]